MDYASLAKKLENQELESSTGQASPQVYSQLLAIYLYLNDLTSAKFLWKRIPQDIKKANEELSTIWLVGKLMWKKNYSEIHSVISSNPSWPNHLKNIMNLISESIRERSIALINKAYSIISVADVANLLNLSKEETLRLAPKYNWVCDEEQTFFEIKGCPTHTSNSNYEGLTQTTIDLLAKFCSTVST